MDDEMWFFFSIWVNGGQPGGTVGVFIDGALCASVDGFWGVDADAPSYFFKIPSASKLHGCGYAGAIMHFNFDGTDLAETIAWQAGYFGSVEILIGFPFARYHGGFTYAEPDWPHWIQVEPRIGGVVCGFDRNPYSSTIENDYVYSVIVKSEQEVAGCGRAGSMIEFYAMLVERNGEVRTQIGLLTTAEWQPVGWVTLPRVTLLDPLPAR